MLNRRNFLSQSAWATFYASLASQSNRFLQAQEKTEAKPVAANDKLRVAVVGVRGRGMSHVGGFNGNHGCEIVAICDCDETVIGKAMTAIESKTQRKPKFVQDFRKLIEDKNIDIISIATPNHWHALMSVWAIQAGKDVYVEKPVSHNVIEGARIVEAARKYNRICQTGTQSRSNPGMRESIKAIHDGKIGKVTLAYATCYKRRGSIGKVEGEQPIPKGCDYDLWCGPAKKLPLMRKSLHYDWHWIWEYGNGDLGNQGIHEMDKARWGLNQNQLPKSVFSVGGRFGYVDDGETANTQLCVFDYGDAQLIFDVRGLPASNPYPGKIGKGEKGSNFVGNIWFGEKGIVVCPSYDRGFLLTPDGEVIQEFKGGGDQFHFSNFVEAVRARDHKKLNADIFEGHLSSALCHLGNISMRLGEKKMLGELKEIAGGKKANEALKSMLSHLEDQKIDLASTPCMVGPTLTIDPKKEVFTGSDVAKANGMLGREYRKGFELPEKV